MSLPNSLMDRPPNMAVVRSVWRRLKKGHIKLRDLQLGKDVKGGGGITDKSKLDTGGTGSR